MKLNATSIEDRKAWEAAGFKLPTYDLKAVAARTAKAPAWIHFGAGNIFRGFPAAVQNHLLNEGKADTGVIVAEGFDYEIIEKAYRPFDNLSVLVTLKSDGTIDKEVIGSVTESLVADSSGADWKRLVAVFEAPSLQMASFTITEKGYSLRDAAGAWIPDVARDLERGAAAPRSIMGKLTALVLARYRAGKTPLALVSMDNCSHNGDKLFAAVDTIAKAWEQAGLCDRGFAAWIADPRSVSFPWSMIDKITPRPDASVTEMLQKAGFESTEIIVTAKKTYTSAFVNAEETEYLIIEDRFPNGKPALDRGGIIYTDRSTVDRVEKMKVCTCLNPLHTTLAIYGCLLGYDSIHREMRDPQLKAFIEKVGYVEGLPVVVNPGIISPRAFIDEVIGRRLPNPFMPDTPQRIACDTSQKLPIRFGETIKAYLANPALSVADLQFIPLVFAGWCRYLMGVDDEGQSFDPSPDPLLETSRKYLAGIALGDRGPFHDHLEGLLSNAAIFGVNLHEAGLGEKVEAYFAELVAGKGAVRKTLQKYLG